LHLESHDSDDKLDNGVFAAISQLSQLTSLSLTGSWSAFEQLQQLLAQPLPLQQLQEVVLNMGISRFALPSLVHLTRLTHLSSTGSMCKGAALPSQLQRLQVDLCIDLGLVLPLQQLQQLTITLESLKEAPDFQQAQLLQLAQLPALKVLELNYRGEAAAAAAAAPTWVLLPQLRSLSFLVWACYVRAADRQRMAAIFEGVAAATQLTGVELDFVGAVTLSQEERACHAAALPICGSLAGLTGLGALRMHQVGLLPDDALNLTALTGLTRLELSRLQDGVNTAAATALLCSLTNLRYLKLVGCSADWGSLELLAAVGRLTQLTELWLKRSGRIQLASLKCSEPGLTQEGLLQLTGLKQLQRLWVDRSDEVTDEVVDSFWAGLQQH
jgi:hypothetical protein